MMVRTKIFVKEDTKMLYTGKEKHEIERVKEVFAEHLRQSPDFEPVSYTHLDVYKRQLVCCAAAPKWLCIKVWRRSEKNL